MASGSLLVIGRLAEAWSTTAGAATSIHTVRAVIVSSVWMDRLVRWCPVSEVRSMDIVFPILSTETEYLTKPEVHHTTCSGFQISVLCCISTSMHI